MKTKMRWQVTAMAVAAAHLAGAAGRAAESPAPAVAQAQKAAEAWLALVDQGQYAKSWEEAASFFRGAVGKDAWVSAVGGVRGQVGKLKSRQLKSAQYTTSLPGVPAGEYVVIQ